MDLETVDEETTNEIHRQSSDLEIAIRQRVIPVKTGMAMLKA